LVNWSYFDSLSNGYNLSDLEFIWYNNPILAYQ
jgi:hypothetical protein